MPTAKDILLADIIGSGGGSGETITFQGSVASFVCEKKASIQSLIGQINPVQDLHSYNNPWPAGGGKNLLPPLTSETKNGVSISVADDGTITINGTASTNTYFDANFTATMLVSERYSVCGFNPVASTDANNMSIFIITDAGNPQVNLNTANAVYSNLATTNANISKWRLKVPKGVTYTNFIVKPMFQIGGDAPTSYAPYSNICPIRGFTGMNITGTGKNLIDDDIVLKYSNTTIAIGNNYDFSIFLKAGTYTLSVEFLNDTHYGAFYRSTKGSTNTSIWSSTGTINSASFTLSEDGWYRIWLYRSSPVSDVNDIGRFQLELGSTATPYEPYTGTTYPITFPSEVGTVYGGYVDPVKEKLVVDRGYVVYDGSSDESWSYYSVTQGNLFRIVVSEMVNFNPDHIMCSVFKPVLQINRTNGTVSGGVATKNLDFIYNSVDDLNGWKLWLSQNPVVVVYKLSTPIIYDITPQQIELLKGVNNIWHDCNGDTKIEYKTGAQGSNGLDSYITAFLTKNKGIIYKILY